MPFSRVIVIVLDSAGVGALPDADEYGDGGANTLRHVIEATGCPLPNMGGLGLHRIVFPGTIGSSDAAMNGPPEGLYGKMASMTAGKDTITGHWELMGVILDRPFPTYPEGFPTDLVRAFEEAIRRKVLGNRAASGTAIIEELGEEHMGTGRPIVYTSADSVFQVAAHEEIIPVPVLYEICETARGLLTGEHAVARVIARPFEGLPGSFRRTARRKDFSLLPSEPTFLDRMSDAGVSTVAIGKISDIFGGRGIDKTYHTKSNHDGMEATLRALKEVDSGFIFVNLVDFDMLYGHRNDARGYAQCLGSFDQYLPRLKGHMNEDDIVFITADHGCDPTTPGTDHTREYAPVLGWWPGVNHGIELETRSSFADLGKTVAELLGVFVPEGPGRSFTYLIDVAMGR